MLAHEFPSGAVDLFTQKGKGLVVLLYGSPGTGKTMTAGKQRGLIGPATNYLKYVLTPTESLAEVAEKPLIRATMGELNQHKLQYFFELSHSGCSSLLLRGKPWCS